MGSKYWAVMPVGRLDACRIEKAVTPLDAVRLAFGYRLTKWDLGKWLAKDMGSKVSVIQSDNKRVALLRDPKDWVDPLWGVIDG